jgi:phage terminase large subunit-like protein
LSESANLRTVIQEEFLKSAVDPVHFFKKYAKIQHPMKGKILFNLYPFQEDTLRQLRDNRFNIILKSRQMGISTLTAGYALHCMIFQADFKILVIATTQEIAKMLVQKVQIMWEFLPAWLKQGLEIVNNNKLSLSFSNGSEIKAVSSSPDAARGSAISLLIMDECISGEIVIQIRNKETGEFENIQIKDLKDKLEI